MSVPGVVDHEDPVRRHLVVDLGARALAADHAYLFVNSDAFVHGQGTLGRLLQVLDDERVGLAVRRLRNPDLSLQPAVVPFSTPLPELVRASGLSRLVPNRLQASLATHWDHGESRPIQAAIGPVLLVRAQLWEQLGGFTERHFMYAEDLDLFWRAAQLGWSARFVGEAEFIHLGGASAVECWADAQHAERVARAQVEMLREHLDPFRSCESSSFGSNGCARCAASMASGSREVMFEADSGPSVAKLVIVGQRCRRTDGGCPGARRTLK